MIRKAQNKDINKIKELLHEVLEIHANIRPDIFISGTTKYTNQELENIIKNDETPIFVSTNENDEVLGYAFCKIEHSPFTTNMQPHKILYIDDLCVDENTRGLHIGKNLIEYVLNYAKQIDCFEVTLNVWEGNDNAKNFYQKMGFGVKETTMEIVLDK